jgi:PAS domain S-box-containing protein
MPKDTTRQPPRVIRGRWSLRTQALVVIAVPVVVVVGNLGGALWFFHQNSRARAELLATQQALVAAAATQATVLNAEASGASFLLSGNARAERGFHADLSTLPAELRTVTAASAPGSPSALRTDVHQLTTDIDALDRVMDATIGSSTGTAGDVADVARLDGRLDTDMVRLRSEVTDLVDHQLAVVNSSGTDLLVLGAVAAGVTVLTGVGLALLFASRVVDRLQLLERATAALADGKPPGDIPDGPDELGQLGRQLADTAQLLSQHEAAQRRARAELDAIMGTSPLVSLRYDVAGHRIAYASPNLHATFGVTVPEALADPTTVTGRLHPDDLDEVRRRVHAELLPGPAGRRVELRVRFRRAEDGPWRTASVVLAATGEPGEAAHRHVVVYVDDVTERLEASKAAEERRQMLESIFDASPDLIVVRNAEDQIVLASGPLAHLQGTGLDRLADGRTRSDPPSPPRQLGAEEIDRLADLLRRCRSGLPTEPLALTMRRPDGSTRTFETRAHPILAADGRITGTVTVSRDVTDRVQLEESLRTATRSAEAASTAKSEFLSRMSHELRTPLNAILGFAQLMELDAMTPEQADCVDHIQRAGQHLLSLINEILDISRIETGHLSVSVGSVEVAPVMAEVANLLAPAAEARGIELQVADDTPAGTTVLADRQRLLQVLLNLGSNAVKYNRPDGLVVFHVAVDGGGRLRFAVTDTGPGIPPERRAELFVPFARLGAERSGIEGTGVGLALSKHLVELMGGTIEVQSEPGRGSTFSLYLTRADATAGAADAPPTDHQEAMTPSDVGPDEEPSSRDWRQPIAAEAEDVPLVVLHVEDNESNAALVAQVLARRPGVQLLSAGLAGVGLELAARHRPDLILLDLHLPDLSGDEFLHRLWQTEAGSAARVVAISADATPGRVRRVLDLGVEAYLTKPVDVGALLRLVDMVHHDRTSSVRPLGGRPPQGPTGRERAAPAS